MTRIASMLLLLIAPALAQTKQPPPSQEARLRTQQALAGLKPDESLYGTYRFGEYCGDKTVGHRVIQVDKAPAGSGAVYRVKIRRVIRFGIFNTTTTETILLDVTLARVGWTIEVNRFGGYRDRLRVSGKPGAWTVVGEHGGRKRKLTSPLQARDHGSLASMLLLAYKLRARQGRYDLRGINWPDAAESFVWGTTSTAKPYRLTLTVGPARTHVHRGRRMRATPVTVSSEMLFGKGMTIVLGPKGELLAFHDDDGWSKNVAGTETQIRSNLKGLETPDLAACRALVEAWIEVGAGEKKPAELDRLVDWRSIHGYAGKRDPSLKGLGVSDLARTIKKRMERAARSPLLALHGSSGLKTFLLVYRTKIGPVVEFNGSFRGSTFLFQKDSQKRWRIVRMPLYALWDLGKQSGSKRPGSGRSSR